MMAEREPAGLHGSIATLLVRRTVLSQTALVILLVVVIASWMYHDQVKRRKPALQSQCDLLAESSRAWLERNESEELENMMAVQRSASSIASAQIVSLGGTIEASTDASEVGGRPPEELAAVLRAHARDHYVFGSGRDITAISPIVSNGRLVGDAVMTPNWDRSRQQLEQTTRIAILYGVLALLANAVVSILLARRVSGPILRLGISTQRVAEGADIGDVFPLKPEHDDEVGQLTRAFNAMAETLERQRAGLNDTLSLLDFMLTNAPIGFAFFDEDIRVVRANQNVADICGVSISRLVGRRADDPSLSCFMHATEGHIAHVFATGDPVRDVEIRDSIADTPLARTWLANFFPVQATNENTRWVGIVLVEVTQGRRAEETMRRTEKLAAAGRMAASIAHEINNPLEGVTNLLYLLNGQPLDDESKRYVEMAEHELRRVSEITQQTLRFYRSSTAAGPVSLKEIVLSIVSLYHGRLLSAQVVEVHQHRDEKDIIGFSGELRQLIANLIGNAIDACSAGDRLLLRSRTATDPRSGVRGVRLTVADTGSGMSPETQRRIFEPFFTTKEETGTGLGLWISAEILAKHYARMKLRSKPGAGTVFSIFFPENAAG